jgi:hypothetical protein
VFRRPNRTIVLIRHEDGDFDAIDIEDRDRRRFIEKASELGPTQSEAIAIAISLAAEWARQSSQTSSSANARAVRDDK